MEFPEFTGDPLEERPTFVDFDPSNAPPLGLPGVYRFRDADDNILYIGESGDVVRRYKEHGRPKSRSKRWFKDAVRCEVCAVLDPSLRLFVETIEILRHRPGNNKAMKLGLSAQGELYALNWR